MARKAIGYSRGVWNLCTPSAVWKKERNKAQTAHIILLNGEDAVLPQVQHPPTLLPLKSLPKTHLWGKNVDALNPSNARILVLDISQYLPSRDSGKLL